MTRPASTEGIIVEFLPWGQFVKVTAIHELTGIEASIVGKPGMPQDHLSQAAVRKLRYVMEKQGK